MTNVLTILTPIRPGLVPRQFISYRERLEVILTGLAQRAGDGTRVPPDQIPTIHFAHWSILPSPEPAHPGQLLFSAVFDGDTREYLRDFAIQIPTDVDEVWGNCTGYPDDGCIDFENFWAFAEAHRIHPTTIYGAYPATVGDVRLGARVLAELSESAPESPELARFLRQNESF